LKHEPGIHEGSHGGANFVRPNSETWRPPKTARTLVANSPRSSERTTPKTRLIYVFDGYGGWCYAFAGIFQRFVTAHRVDFEVEAIPAGLFTGDRRAPLAECSELDEDVFEIPERTGVRFGQPYLELLAQGDFVMDSFDAARAFLALRSCIWGHDAEIAASMQRAFFLNGQSLSAPETCVGIAARYGIREPAVRAALSRTDDAMVARAFARVHALGVSVLPTVLIETRQGIFTLCVGSATLPELELRLGLA
jgi:putative protein-disulfide isomerase